MDQLMMVVKEITSFTVFTEVTLVEGVEFIDTGDICGKKSNILRSPGLKMSLMFTTVERK